MFRITRILITEQLRWTLTEFSYLLSEKKDNEHFVELLDILYIEAAILLVFYPSAQKAMVWLIKNIMKI